MTRLAPWLSAGLIALAACGPSPADEADADPNAPDASSPGIDAADPVTDGAPGTPDAETVYEQCISNTGGVGLRLRDEPSTNGNILLTMPEGARVIILDGPTGQDNAWYHVDYLGTVGYAHGDYLADCPMPGTGDGFNFLLPWAAGLSYRTTQGHNTGSHTGSGGWAWDFGMAEGTPILAAHGGVVRLVRYDSNFGACDSSAADDANYVVIDRGDGLESLYLHLRYHAPGERPLVVGQVIDRGTLIGYSGQTGWACGAHLHMQIQLGPSNGGTASWYNPSVHEYFWDTDKPYDPPAGSDPVSANGTSMQPFTSGDFHAPTPVPHLHGDGPAWDEAMKAAAARDLRDRADELDELDEIDLRPRG